MRFNEHQFTSGRFPFPKVDISIVEVPITVSQEEYAHIKADTLRQFLIADAETNRFRAAVFVSELSDDMQARTGSKYACEMVPGTEQEMLESYIRVLLQEHFDCDFEYDTEQCARMHAFIETRCQSDRLAEEFHDKLEQKAAERAQERTLRLSGN